MHYDNSPIVQIRRTQLDISDQKLQAEIIQPGESLLLNTAHQILTNDNSAEATAPSLRGIKLIDQTLINNSAYFEPSSTDATKVHAKSDNGTDIYWDSESVKRHSSDITVEEDLLELHTRMTNAEDMLELKANLDSPVLTGAPNAPNPKTGVSERIATTSWVSTQITNNREEKQALANGNIYITGVKVDRSAADANQEYYCANQAVYINTSTGKLYGAAWNDFAEFEKTDLEYAPGTVVAYKNDCSMTITTEDMQSAAAVISDTYGITVGASGNEYQPIAVSGRVLVNYADDLSDYKIGDCVCAAPFGVIRKMTRDEIKEYPDRILGVVCGFPDGAVYNKIDSSGRIWIKVK